MKRLCYIVVFALLFLLVALIVRFSVVEALPMVLLGGCIGWALAEFQREVKKHSKKN